MHAERKKSSSISKNTKYDPAFYTDEQLADVLSPRHFVAVRTTLGGPAPAVTGPALREAREALEADRAWLASRRDALQAASDERAARTRSL